MEKKNKNRKPAPIPIGHDYRGKDRNGHCPQGDCKAPDGISGYWGDSDKQSH